MAESSDKLYIVHPKHYKKDLEDRVALYMQSIPELPKETRIHSRTTPPRFKSPTEREMWEMEEIRRIRDGHDGMCGTMYFYYNYCYIQKIKGGKIKPDFRVADHEFFKRIENAMETVGRGFIGVKRRRVGASWKICAVIMRLALLNTQYNIGMNSKSETDSRVLFKKIHFIYDNLPLFLRPKIGSKTKDSIEFFRMEKDEAGNNIKGGHENTIVAKAPTVSAFEGYMLNMWVCDEAGKVGDDLLQMFSFTEDTMMDEYQRTGTPVIFGTVGEIDKAGAGLLELWRKNEDYGLDKFFIGGWMGLFCDEYGNDRIEEAVRWIVYEGEKQKRRGNKYYIDFLQKYPLNEEHAFSISTDGGLGDLASINARRQHLIDNPPKAKRGFFRWGLPSKDEDSVVFVPKSDGDIIIYEDVDKKLSNAYVAGSDPAAQVDNPLAGTSNMSLFIRRRQVGLSKPKIVLEYTARPKVGTEFFEQSIMALIYYNNCKALVESNVMDMINYFTSNGYQYLLYHEPKAGRNLNFVKATRVGGRMTEPMRRYMEQLINRDLEDNLDTVDSEGLLNELPLYGIKNVDRVYAYGWALIQEQELYTPATRGDQSEKFSIGYKYIKRGGKIMKVRDTQVQRDSTMYDGIEGGTIMTFDAFQKLRSNPTKKP